MDPRTADPVELIEDSMRRGRKPPGESRQSCFYTMPKSVCEDTVAQRPSQLRKVRDAGLPITPDGVIRYLDATHGAPLAQGTVKMMTQTIRWILSTDAPDGQRGRRWNMGRIEQGYRRDHPRDHHRA